MDSMPHTALNGLEVPDEVGEESVGVSHGEWPRASTAAKGAIDNTLLGSDSNNGQS